MKFKRVLAFLLAVVLSLSCAGDFGMLTAYAAEDVSASAYGSVAPVEPVPSETAEELTELFEETSVEPVSAEEALAAEIPAEEAPAEELSVVEEAPVVVTPVVETPAEEPEVILPAYAYESYTGLAPIDDFYTELYVDLEGWLPTDAFVWFEGAEFSDLNENDIPLYIWRVHVCGPQAVDYEPEPGETVNVTLRGETVARMLREGWDLRVRVLQEYQDERDAIEVETTVTWDNALSFDVPSFFRWVIYRHTEPAAAETPVAEKAPVLSGLQAAPAAVPSLTGTGAPAASLNAAPAVSDSGSDYVFPAATVALSDVLSAVGITLRQNNYSVSVDSPAVSLSGNRVNRNGLGSFTLTAQESFSRATLSLTSTNGKDSHTVTLSYPVPVEEPEDGLVEFVPENAIWANDDLYLTGKMPGNAVVVATPVTVGIAGEQVLAAYDIKIYPNRNQVGKKEWNPKQQQSKVQVHFFEDAFADQDLMVYHLADAQSEPEYVATVRAEDGWISFEAESFSVYAVTSVIEKTVEIGGSTYRVSVVYDSTARIPEGTELNVSELGQDAYLADAEQALHVGEDDTVYYTKFLDIALVHNGEAVEPQAPVQVTVELLDADEAAELGLQVVHFGLGGAEAITSRVNDDGAVTFETESFSPFGFTSILSTLMSWTDDLFSFSLLGVSSLFSPRYTPAALPTLEEGLEALEAYTVSSTGLLGSLTGLFVKVSRSAALALGTLESVTVYGLKDGAAGAVLTEDLGTEAQTLSLSGADGFVMVQDTGYRRFNFELDNVTLNGMMPKASEAVAADVGEAYAVFTPEGEDAFEALAAYDISISSGGEEYQPDAEHPVAVSIALPDEAQDLDPEALEVWHVRDDGTKERVEDITVENGRVRFEATGFSVYVVTGYVLETTIDIEGQTYKVTATYDDNAGLPGDAKLSVSEVSVDDPRYVTYLNDTAEALGVSAGELGYLRLLDIAIVGEDGTKFTPNDQVKVTVELIDEIETGDLRVVHFGAETEEIAAETEGDTVTFTTDSFSVFSFVDLTLVQSVVDAVFGSTYTDKIYENDDIIVSGRMPRTAIVEVNPAEVEIEGADVLVAYDIKIYAGVITKALGIAWQPTDGALRVQMKSDAIDVENVDVYHMADANSEAELVAEEVAVEENTVFFEASAFSIYTVINHQPPRRTYSFYTLNDQDQYVPFYFRTDSGEETYQQIIKNGESLTVPELPSIDSDTTTFAGWYVFTPNSGATVPPVPGTNGTLAAESFNFNAIPAVTVDGEEVILCARFSSFIYAIFHEQYNGSTQTWPILATRRGEVNSNTATIQISDLKVSYDDTISNDPNDPNPVATQKAFRGWSYDQQTEQNPNPTVITGDSITISQNVNLYPVFVSINWLTYQSGPVGSGATYCAPVFYYVDEGATRFPIPVRVGYTFDGWYTAETGGVRLDSNTIVTETTEGGETVNYHGLNTSANLTGSADFEIVSGQLHLKQDATIYAHWTEAPTKYSIVIWRQSVNDTVGLADSEKTYDFAESRVVTANTGSTATVSNSDKSKAGTGDYVGFHFRTCDNDAVVKGDGNTVLNVYYDRDLMTINFVAYLYNGYNYNRTSNPTNTGSYIVKVGEVFYPVARNGNSWYYFNNDGQPVRYSGRYYYPVYSTDYYNYYYQQEIQSWTGLYGQTFAEAGYSWNTVSAFMWRETPGNIVQTFLDSFNTSNDNTGTVYNLNYYSLSGSSIIYHYRQQLDGSYSTSDREIAYGNGGNFSFTNKYDGFTVSSYSTGTNGFSSTGGTPVAGRTANEYPLHVYHERNPYTLTFIDSYTNQVLSTQEVKFGENLSSYIPSNEPVSTRVGYGFTGWYSDTSATAKFNFNRTMPSANVAVYAGWATVWYRIEIDPNYGELTGSQSTFFWEPYNGDPIREYETVTRNYVPSINGTWYFYSLDRDYYGLGDEWDEIEDTISDRGAGYTQDINHPGVDLSVRYEAQTDAYRYANWYEVKPDGSETLYKFGEPVNHDTKLRLHWKQVGTYYLRYDAGAGSLDAGDSNEDTFKVLDSADYVDRSYVVVNRTANAPAGKNFIGWRVRGGGTTIYYPGQGLEFNAQYAVTEIGSDGVERRYIVMDAVYSELETADLVYDANDGVVIADQVDWGTSLAEQGGGLPTTKTTTSTRASLLGVQNNTGVVLSNGSGFSNGSLTLRGWNTQRDGHGTHFDLGDTVYLDTAGENVLFAEWEVKVYFYLNNERGDWNGTWPTGFVLDSVNNRYIYAMLANNSVPYPGINPVQPSVSGVEDQQFQYWSRERYLNSAPPQYNFSTPVTHDLQLYAYWAAPKQVPIHVVDASSETLVNKDAQWRTASFCVVNGTVHFESTSDAAVYTNIPSGYRYAFATASRTLDSISENDRIDYIYYNSNDEHAVWVHYHDGRDEALSSDREVYLIYFEDPQYLTINYLLMSNEGLLNPQTVNSSAPTQATLGVEGYDMKAAISAPMSWADAPANQITNYTYAVCMPLPAGETVDHARYLRVISDVSGNDTTRPDFKLRHTWRGYEYSVNDGASWTNCGYDIRLCVIYYKQFPITVRVHELTRGLEQDETKRFTYHVTIAQTVSTTDTVKVNGGANQEGASETWKLLDYYEFTLADDEDQAYSVFFQQRTPSGTETVNGKTWAFANPGDSTITLTQTITITQTADTDFTTTNTIAHNAGPNGTYSYTFTSYNNAPDQVATYTNVRTQMKVELHVAEAYGEPLLLRDELRVSNPAAYHVTIPINNRAALAPTGSEVKLPVDGADFFPRHNDTDHIFGGLFYGVVNEGVATVTHDRITAVSFERISGSSFYGVYVYFQDGTRELMDESHYIFYGYYYLPTIVYMRENYDGSLSRINPIEANGSAVTLNGGTVTQDAVLALNYVAGQQGATFTISQASGTGYFHVPPTLDGESTLSLDYSRLAVNGSGITSVNDPSLRFAEDKVIMLRFQQNGPMEYSIDGGVTWSIPPDVPVVYVIYREKGHDLTIRKNVDGPSTYQAQTFTGVVISNLLTKSEYAVTVHNPNGTTTETTTTAIGARVTPASGGQPGTIEVPLRNGTDATIHGLPTGNYAAQEWIPAGVDLNNVELSVYLQRAGRYANVTTFNDGTHQGYTLSSTGSGSTYYRVDSDVILVLTNTRKTQTVTITKTLVDPVVNSATFTFTGRLMDGPTDITSDIAGLSSFTITANTPVPGQPHTYTGTATFTLPVGAVLTVTESMTQAESELYEGTPATGSLTVSETAAENELNFTNTRKSARLTITKNVTGDMGDRSSTIQFTFTLVSVADEAPGTTYTWTKTAVGGTTSSGTLTTTAGSNTFTLAHSESIVIELPLNKAVEIRETNGLYTPNWSTSGGAVTLTNPGTSTVTATLTGDAHVTITNDLPAVAPTGLSFREAPYVWILGIGAVLVWSAVLLPKKKKEED